MTQLPLSQLLLLDNAHFKWFLLVPEVKETQLHLLSQTNRTQLFTELQSVSLALESLYQPDRLNVGAIGNLVPQLHLHLIARSSQDPEWPNTTWGTSHQESYPLVTVDHIRKALLEAIPST